LLSGGALAAPELAQRVSAPAAPGARDAIAPPGAPGPRRVAAFAWLRPRDGVLVISGPATDFGYRIDRLHVTEGEMVEAGQPLAELDVKAERAASLAVAASQALEAQVNAQYAARELARKQALFHARTAAISARDLDAAQVAAASAQAKFETAESQRDHAQIMLDQATIRAPAAGMILRIMKHAGEGFTPGQGLIELGEVSHMQAVAEVFETDARDVRPGEKAEFSSPALPHPVAGVVLRIEPRTDRVSLYQTNAAAHAESRVVRVVISLNDDPVVRRLTGLQGIVRITASAGS
jgi:HlyD family secretion protein